MSTLDKADALLTLLAHVTSGAAKASAAIQTARLSGLPIPEGEVARYVQGIFNALNTMDTQLTGLDAKVAAAEAGDAQALKALTEPAQPADDEDEQEEE